MTDSPRPLRAIPSPCVNVCMLHPDSDLCIGCRRTVEEIARWTSYSDDERRRILAELASRSHEETM